MAISFFQAQEVEYVPPSEGGMPIYLPLGENRWKRVKIGEYR